LKHLRVALLILAAIAGQVHSCQAIWVLPDGSTCNTCPTQAGSESFDKATEAQSEIVIGSKSPQDCLACCTVTACDEDSQDSLRAASAIQLDFILIDQIKFEASVEVPVSDAVSIHIVENYPNAPPHIFPARAPPIQLV
jgi:hypothetical protein